ncbi:hypothetical protein SAMN05660206_10423 [Sphingobacterium wenxiniae]|uniref:Uncharacterized protein n=1 Tax=Sphingobacterium wenxiniae TaxID=683125 RepID=A0A1I6RYE4_9SPHI|nr:hypothetical protein SAMN05660206_10423 [Sphingobacterium wenxiniae]
MKPENTKPDLSKSSRFNRKAMKIMNITAITVFVLAILYKLFLSK